MRAEMGLVTELEQWTAIPNAVDMKRLSPSLRHELLYLWWSTAHDLEADMEADFIDPSVRDLFDDEQSVRAAVHNWRRWGPEARRQFNLTGRPFVEMHLSSTGRAADHLPAAGESEHAIRDRTVNSDSVFFPACPIAHLEPLLFDLLAARFEELAGLHHARIATCLEITVGATNGRDTRCLAFDIDFSTPEAHAFPVSPMEARLEQFFVPSSEL